MLFNDDEEPPPTKPRPARTMGQVQVTNYHRTTAPMAPNEQEVLVELKGGFSAAGRASLDLVVVIDVSGSMGMGGKLEKTKEALCFVISKLRDHDRLCIITFSHDSTRLCALRCVSKAARAELRAIVYNIEAYGTTNIQGGLEIGLRVIANRKITAGRATCIMLLSDGEQNLGDAREVETGGVLVHTFGFGADHDPTVLEAIAKKSLGGVFSYVDDNNDNKNNVTTAFSQILGGLLTIVAQDLKLNITPFPGEASIKSVDAGIYPLSCNTAPSSVTVTFGILYSAEVRKVVIVLALSDAYHPNQYRPSVAEVRYSFTLQGQQVTSDPKRITIRRSRSAANPANAPLPPQVQAEMARQQHAQFIMEAMERANGGKLEDARNILAEAMKALDHIVEPTMDMHMIRKELLKLLELFKTREVYQRQGRPYAISSIVSHGRQRFATRGNAEDVRLFATRRMDAYLVQGKQSDDKSGDKLELPSSDDDEIQEVQQQDLEVPHPQYTAGAGEGSWVAAVKEKRTLSVMLRVLTAVLSLLAFSIMGSARMSAWNGDSYGQYDKWYAVGVNVTVCIYSIVQASVEICHLDLPRSISWSISCYFFFFDQVLAYLLMSASSVAASRNHLWVSRSAKDQFNIAVSFSFLGFIALSVTANLFSRILY